MSRPNRVAGQRAEASVATISPLRRWLNRTLLGLGLALVGAGLFQGGASLSAQQVERLTVLGDVRHIDAAAILARLDSKEMVITVDRDIAEPPEALTPFRAELLAGRQISISYPPSRAHSGEIIAAIQNAGYVITNLTTKEADLEEVFLRLTSHQAPDGSREAAAQ